MKIRRIRILCTSATSLIFAMISYQFRPNGLAHEFYLGNDKYYMFMLDLIESVYEAVFEWIQYSCLVLSSSDSEDDISGASGSKRQRLETSQVSG